MANFTKIDGSVVISGENCNVLDIRKLLDSNASDNQQIICADYVIVEDYSIDKVDISCIDFCKGICFRNCCLGSIYATSSNFGIHEDNESFDIIDVGLESLTLSNCFFKGDVHISLDKENKPITKLIESEDCRICGDLHVSNIILDVGGEININGKDAIIRGNCEFRYCNIKDGLIDFRGDVLGELRFYCINASLESCNSSLEFHGVKINCLRLLDCYFHRLNVVNVVIGNIQQQNTVFDIMENAAVRLFRNAAMANNDEILILEYTGELYNQYLANSTMGFWKKLIKKKSWVNSLLNRRVIFFFASFVGSIFSAERFLLWINKYSNDFNRSWFRGMLFTALVALGSYLLLNYFGMESQYFIVNGKCNGFSDILLGYVSMLDIAGWSNSKDLFQLTSSGKIIMFFAKLFITYGIWQTIYAFYKYKK